MPADRVTTTVSGFSRQEICSPVSSMMNEMRSMPASTLSVLSLQAVEVVLVRQAGRRGRDVIGRKLRPRSFERLRDGRRLGGASRRYVVGGPRPDLRGR